jgi:hypothetical protein
MTTGAIKLEQNDERFRAVFEGISAYCLGLKIYDNPYPARSICGDLWELAYGRLKQNCPRPEIKEGKCTNTK